MANLSSALRFTEHWKRAIELKPSLDDLKFASLPLASLHTLLPHGLRRGSIAEIHGTRSSGRTALSFHILAEATSRGEICAVVDLHDNFHPSSASAAGVQLDRLVWVRCGGHAPFAMRSIDLLLHAGGFGVVSLDVCEASARVLNSIPLSYWHRFRQTLQDTPTILLICAASLQAKSCASNNLQTKVKASQWSAEKPFSLLKGLEVHATAGKVTQIRPQTFFLPALP